MEVKLALCHYGMCYMFIASCSFDELRHCYAKQVNPNFFSLAHFSSFHFRKVRPRTSHYKHWLDDFIYLFTLLHATEVRPIQRHAET